ncbi:hypothetical protein VKT23_016891 [Stygiomarasmius scandens]|uniref:Pali-domain-containing protein n=1 Tax=Marasmiellus scandens TaxID=2682957 RepID=A0ABR1IVA8_9AGAR
MSRKFLVPGTIFLLIAFVLSFLASISVPTLHAIDIVRINSNIPDGIKTDLPIAKDTRLGIWGFCQTDLNDDEHCSHTGHGYNFPLLNLAGNIAVIGSSWTRGLAVHPVATAAIFAAFCLSFSSHVTALLAAMITSILAAFLTLLAFIIDIALYAYVHHQAKKISDGADNALDVDTAPGFWLSFVSLLFTLFAGCTVFVGRRKAADSSPSYPMMTNPSGFFSRFRKN